MFQSFTQGERDQEAVFGWSIMFRPYRPCRKRFFHLGHLPGLSTRNTNLTKDESPAGTAWENKKHMTVHRLPQTSYARNKSTSEILCYELASIYTVTTVTTEKTMSFQISKWVTLYVIIIMKELLRCRLNSYSFLAAYTWINKHESTFAMRTSMIILQVFTVHLKCMRLNGNEVYKV